MLTRRRFLGVAATAGAAAMSPGLARPARRTRSSVPAAPSSSPQGSRGRCSERRCPQFHPDADRAAWFETVYDIQRDHGSAGVAFWNLGHELTPVGQSPTTFVVSPQAPLVWSAVRANAPL